MIKRVEHVAIMVTNMDESIDFYKKLFGFEVRQRGQNKKREMTFLYLPSEPGFEIELMRDLVPSETYHEKGLVNHLAFTVDNIEEAFQFLKENGVEPHSETPNIAIDGAKTMFFSGPNNELLQFVER
ncbi:glyoxalase [Anaerobacillus arseniciselenatis]|uniref:Glyoxalase n=1 Tax=Anaerobacillus arseniciselenatis TaxID=85682 RepID=A0A1S2LPW7_9BACI|nr:VOC family protein [Anaerobacillus arseniciselenatis]OIJ14552.1 glyoxalase [Anaerobacillus arseniciselenatis]